MIPYVEDGCMNMNEGGTCWRSLSVMVDEMLSMAESVWRFDNGVGNGKNDDVEAKRFIFSFGTINWSVEFVSVDWDWKNWIEQSQYLEDLLRF